MIKRTLCFESDGHLSVKDRQLVFQAVKDGVPVTKSASIENLGVVVLESQHIEISTYALDALAENNTTVVVCDGAHMPSGTLLPLSGHSETQRVTAAQLAAPAALREKLWKQTVVAKIRNQSECLRQNGKNDADRLESLSKFVKAGDPENREGTAAATYFKAWGFVRRDSRDDDAPMPNPALNYGYAILRACMARALVGSGLLCVRGIHHHNEYNSMPLADDIMEPYRPFVDNVVLGQPDVFGPWNTGTFTRSMKIALLSALASDVVIGQVRRPLMNAVSYTSASLAACFDGREEKIRYPEFPS